MAQRQKQKLYRETDYYKTLGLASSSASQQDIKDGFRQLAKQYHPDKAKGDREVATRKFQEVSAAYEVLSNNALRSEYDTVWRQCHARPHGKSTSSNSLDPRWAPTGRFARAAKAAPPKRGPNPQYGEYKTTSSMYGAAQQRFRTKVEQEASFQSTKTSGSSVRKEGTGGSSSSSNNFVPKDSKQKESQPFSFRSQTQTRAHYEAEQRAKRQAVEQEVKRKMAHKYAPAKTKSTSDEGNTNGSGRGKNKKKTAPVKSKSGEDYPNVSGVKEDMRSSHTSGSNVSSKAGDRDSDLRQKVREHFRPQKESTPPSDDTQQRGAGDEVGSGLKFRRNDHGIYEHLEEARKIAEARKEEREKLEQEAQQELIRRRKEEREKLEKDAQQERDRQQKVQEDKNEKERKRREMFQKTFDQEVETLREKARLAFKERENRARRSQDRGEYDNILQEGKKETDEMLNELFRSAEQKLPSNVAERQRKYDEDYVRHKKEQQDADMSKYQNLFEKQEASPDKSTSKLKSSAPPSAGTEKSRVHIPKPVKHVPKLTFQPQPRVQLQPPKTDPPPFHNPGHPKSYRAKSSSSGSRPNSARGPPPLLSARGPRSEAYSVPFPARASAVPNVQTAPAAASNSAPSHYSSRDKNQETADERAARLTKLKESLRLDRLKYGLAGAASSNTNDPKLKFSFPAADRNDSPSSSSSSGSQVFSKHLRASVSSGLDNLFSDFMGSGGGKTPKNSSATDTAKVETPEIKPHRFISCSNPNLPQKESNKQRWTTFDAQKTSDLVKSQDARARGGLAASSRPKGLVTDVECAASKESTLDSADGSSSSKQPKNAQTITGMLRGAFGLFNNSDPKSKSLMDRKDEPKRQRPLASWRSGTAACGKCGQKLKRGAGGGADFCWRCGTMLASDI